MMIRFKKNNLQFEAGDVSVNETEFTTSYLNRRGLRFELNNKSLYLNSFYTNSQQKTGFDGYGIPDAKAGIFGAVAGVNLKNTMKIRGMFMTGKDNLDSKTISYNEFPCREGDLFSLWGELSLLKNRLQVAGEISSSHFGAAAVEEELAKKSDTAWKAGLKYNQGILSFAADYEEIGDHFNSIANLFLQNDREGLSTNLGPEHQVVLLEPLLYRQKKLRAQPDPGRAPPEAGRHHLQLGHRQPFPHRRRPVARQPGLRLLDRPANFVVRHEHQQLHRLVRVHGRLERRQPSTSGETESVHFTSNLNASLALNLRFGRFMSLNPTLSYQENENLGDNSKSTIYNLYLNSEITLIPQYFTVTISSSYMNNESPFSKSYSWTAGCNLNFFAAKIFKDKIRPSLSLKSMFQGAKYGEAKTDASIFHLQADIAF